MMKLGDYNELEIIKEVEFGLYLKYEEGEILLPKKYVTEDMKLGEVIRVFVYKDSEDRLVATTKDPKAKVGDIAYLTVKDTNSIGAFLDWGLEKDLLVPFSEQKVKMQAGNSYFVKIYVDEETKRIVATSKFLKLLDKQNEDLKEFEEVDIQVLKFTELGASVIINNKYIGAIYKNDMFTKLNIGDKLKGYVNKVREDGKIDISLRKYGFNKLFDAQDVIIDKLRENNGFLQLTDKSTPLEIENELEMSKGAFKKAVGMLYKQKKIELLDNGIKLLEK